MNSLSIENKEPELRLRVFAGPNGSGKSTVIKFIQNFQVNGKPIDFGVYINADDIARQLREDSFSFSDYKITVTRNEFIDTALASGLVGGGFESTEFVHSFTIKDQLLHLKTRNKDEYVAQIIADFLRKKLLQERKKFSFETVFSHPSKLDIMREAAENGYKVYLYFVSTKSPDINKFRVIARSAKGGHNVPPDKIESRYYRSLQLLFDAAQIAYQVFFWDNSVDGKDANMFAHFKKTGATKKWDKINMNDVPGWFLKYYSGKVG